MIEKTKAWLSWIGILIAKLLAWPYSLIVYPIAYPVRDWARSKNEKNFIAFLLWITLDDENDYGEPWYLKEHGNPPLNFWTAWKWSYLRNNSWNLNSVLVRPIEVEWVVSGFNTSKESPLDHNRFKWEILELTVSKSGNMEVEITDGWDVNQGDRLSQKYTRLGRAWCWYAELSDLDKTRLFRGSYCGIIAGIMVNIKIGFNKRGEALLDVKTMIYKSKYMEHWEL